MNPDLNMQPTINVSVDLFNQVVSLVVWFFTNYGIDLLWAAAITTVALLLIAGIRFILP
jgi:hypothetical protein